MAVIGAPSHGLMVAATAVSSGSAEANQSQDAQHHFAAVWNRPLSSEEVLTAYASIKSWLATLGVAVQ